MAELVLEHVDKVFPNGVHAVHDLCLRVQDGELVVLAGPSGCGKTTTLRLIAGLEQPTQGHVSIGGRLVTDLPPRERDVAMVFQRPALYPYWSVRRNLGFSLSLRHRLGWPRRAWRRCFSAKGWSELHGQERQLDDRVADAARLLGLEYLLDRRPEQLSGGERQRVGLGRALVRRPAVFLLDEPLSQLDPGQRADLRRELHLLQCRLPATMVYVTHDQVEAMTLADRLVILDKGRLQQADTPSALYERPGNRFVAGFLGWPTMNLLDGRLVPDGNHLSFRTDGWSWLIPQDLAAAWAAQVHRPVTVGLRPEAVQLGQADDPAVTLVMEVALVEPLGRGALVTLRRQGWQLAALAGDRQGLAPAQMVKVAMNLHKAHLFDGVSGLALYNI